MPSHSPVLLAACADAAAHHAASLRCRIALVAAVAQWRRFREVERKQLVGYYSLHLARLCSEPHKCRPHKLS